MQNMSITAEAWRMAEDSLARLQEEERLLSRRRARLQERIDFVRAGTGGSRTTAAEQLWHLEGLERELSEQRRRLHARIDALRRGRTATG
jgi:predicted  nucleic acid-binding Zn-ribbon protein